MLLRTIHCNVCGGEQTEPAENVGWAGWAQIVGVRLDDRDNPHLCPACLARVMEFVEGIKGD